MSKININLSVVAYADEDKSINPLVKFTDLRWSLFGLPTDNARMIPVALGPGESMTVMADARSITLNGASTYSIAQVSAGPLARLVGSIGQRTARADGDATTQWAITKLNTVMVLTYTGTGTAPTFGGMTVGDGLTIDAPFSESNRGDFVVVKVGATYVEVLNPLVVAETVTGQVEIYSSGPVQIGDILDVTSAAFSQPNRGEFTVSRVTDEFIEFSSANAVPEAVTGVSTGIVIYPEAFRWMTLASDQKLRVRLNQDTGEGVIVDPPTPGDFVNSPGLFLKRGKVFQVDLLNLSSISRAKGALFLAE